MNHPFWKILKTIVRPLIVSCLIVALFAIVGNNKNGSLAVVYALDDYNHLERSDLAFFALESLIFIGADPDTSPLGPKMGGTLLHDAVGYGDYEFAELLLESGADPNIQDSGGDTPLTLALFLENPEMVDLLKRHKADLDARNAFGKTPLLTILGNPILLRFKVQVPEMYENNKADALKLIEFGANVHVQDNRGITPLMMAAKLGDKELLKAILNRGKRVRFAQEHDHEGRNAVDYALDYGSPAIATFLRQYGLVGKLL